MASKDEEDKKAAAERTAAIKKANDAVQSSKNASQPNYNTPTSTVEPPTPTSSEGTRSLPKFGSKIEGKEYKASNDNNLFATLGTDWEEVARKEEEEKQRERDLKSQQGIASDLKDLSRRGALTGDLLKQARERATTAGVSKEQFNSFMEKNRIRPSNFATAPKSSSPEEAAQNVLFELEHGSGLKAMDIRSNDPNYKFGSGSVLNQPARRVGPESGKLRNMARRLKRAGNPYWRQAQYAAEMMRLKEPRIDTPALKRQRALQKIITGKVAQRQIKAPADSAETVLGHSGSGGSGGLQTSEFRDVNGNGIEDRKEGIYRKGEYSDPSQASITKLVVDAMRDFGVS